MLTDFVNIAHDSPSEGSSANVDGSGLVVDVFEFMSHGTLAKSLRTSDSLIKVAPFFKV